MSVDIEVPDGVSGDWSVSTFEVSDKEAKRHSMMSAWSSSCRPISAGTYKQLKRKNHLVMSNTPMEIRDHSWFASHARKCERVLLNGLGLGMVLKMILESETVKHVTVIEKSEDVIKLSAQTYLVDPRVEIIHADAFEWKPPRGARYGAVFHDIWDDICGDNLPEMIKLKSKYRRRTDYQECWCEDQCRRQR